jgi:hypothetical protein
MRPKSIVRASISRSGVLSSSEIGLLRENSISAAIQRAPVRMIPGQSARYTWCTRKLSHTPTRWCTDSAKLSAWIASAAALIAPAEVPHTIGNGLWRG